MHVMPTGNMVEEDMNGSAEREMTTEDKCDSAGNRRMRHEYTRDEIAQLHRGVARFVNPLECLENGVRKAIRKIPYLQKYACCGVVQ